MAHYFDMNPETPSQTNEFSFEMEGRAFFLTTDRGVFSRSGLDVGSEIFLRELIRDLRDDPVSGRLIDVGCGYGVLGIVLKRVFPAFELTLTDVNRRALELTRQNLKANDISYAEVVESDGFSALESESFDVMVTNPPIRAGKSTVYRIFEEGKSHLRAGGRLYAVVGKKQGAPSLERYLQGLFGNCRRIGRDKGFWVFRCDIQLS